MIGMAGISVVECPIITTFPPAYRRHEHGKGAQRELREPSNKCELKGTNVKSMRPNRDVVWWGGGSRSSDESSVMGLERRG